MVRGRQGSKLSEEGKQHKGKGRRSKYTGRLGELPVASYMSGHQAHDIAPPQKGLGRVKGPLQPFTKAVQHFLFLPVIWVKSLSVPLDLLLAPSFVAERLPVVCCRGRCLPQALSWGRIRGQLK